MWIVSTSTAFLQSSAVQSSKYIWPACNFGFGLIDGQGFPGIGNPVMLHGEDGRSGIDPQDLDANCALQIASGDAER